MSVRCGALVALAVGASCAPEGPTIVHGPDAVVAMHDGHSDDLQWSCVRPAHEVDDPTCIDPRTSLSVLDADSATWLASARLNRSQGLAVSSEMQADLIDATPARDRVFTLDVVGSLPEADAAGRCVVAGGQWRWDGPVTGTGICRMSLVDSSDVPVVLVQMDSDTAWNMYRRLDGMVRTAPSQGATIEQLEHSQ